MKDRLFLLRPGFFNSAHGPLYCSDSVPIEGLLGFFPQLRELIDIRYLEYSRPRQPLIQVLGADHQSLPVLIIAGKQKMRDGNLEFKTAGTELFIDDEKLIRHYLSVQYGLPQAS